MSTTSDQRGKQAKDLTRDLKKMGRSAGHAAHESLGQLRENASEYCEQGLNKLRHAKHNMAQFILGLPIKSVLIAVCVGFLLGSAWPRR